MITTSHKSFSLFSGLDSMIEVFRRRVIGMMMNRGLLKEDFVENLMSWRHSGFSIDNSVRIFDDQTRENLAEYMARPPLSLKKIRREPFKPHIPSISSRM
jgi:hypothetical protein